MSQYTSEVREWPHPRSLKNIEVSANKWGSVAGTQFAEAFKMILSVI